MSLEVERKFLLSEYPQDYIENKTIDVVSIQHIEQLYLAIAQGEELRMRKLTDRNTGIVEFVLTYKNGLGIVRTEVEQPITQALYEELLSKFKPTPLLKERTTAKLKETETIIEIDRYDHLPLIVVEVEFQSEEDAIRFTPPDWFGRDISSNKQYSNKELWRQLNRG